MPFKKSAFFGLFVLTYTVYKLYQSNVDVSSFISCISNDCANDSINSKQVVKTGKDNGDVIGFSHQDNPLVKRSSNVSEGCYNLYIHDQYLVENCTLDRLGNLVWYPDALYPLSVGDRATQKWFFRTFRNMIGIFLHYNPIPHSSAVGKVIHRANVTNDLEVDRLELNPKAKSRYPQNYNDVEPEIEKREADSNAARQRHREHRPTLRTGRPEHGEGSAAPSSRKPCKNPSKRRSWYQFTKEQKKDYINAELCLMRVPGVTGLPGTKSRWDDLTAIHQTQTDHIHLTAYFLPFHRLMLHAHETALRKDCGYKGDLPYWDETIDAGRFSTAAMFDPDPVFGMGGNSGKSGCVADGAFSHMTLHVGPGRAVTNHCLQRHINNELSWAANQKEVDICLSMPRFTSFWACVEHRPHTGGHFGVGGEMANAVSSPGDPLFYLHHAYIDRIWWQWQQKDLEKRVKEIAGSTVQKGHGRQISPEDRLLMKGIIHDRKVWEVLDIQAEGGLLCYEYV